MKSNHEHYFSNSYENYILDDDDVIVYEKSKKLAKYTDYPGMVAAAGLSLGVLGLGVNILSYLRHFLASEFSILTFINTTPAPLSEIIRFGGLLIVSFVFTTALVMVGLKFQSTAKGTDITQKKYRLNILARGLSKFHEGSHEQAISQLSKFDELENTHISSFIESNVEQYLKNLEKEDSDEYLEKTFEDFLCLLMEEVSSKKTPREAQLEIITNSDSLEYYNIQNEDKQRSVTYLSIIKESLSELALKSFVPNFWLLYLCSAVVGIATFNFIDKTLGILTVTILLTGLQIHDRRNRTGEEDDQ
ncbi:hypothetical protein [Halopelagius longus]|uniref:Uncharacterized protein n=1 Tax=Halopelagius longus TaxID=1236180 RepID=A0A1H1AWD3_9EURY|nr:hypothetical protein [Halopelagius longus]SDQ43980.1 hypothetical protein SAMN05216278_1520 [Halopelagius longus]